jgi:hypothetical protein
MPSIWAPHNKRCAAAQSSVTPSMIPRVMLPRVILRDMAGRRGRRRAGPSTCRCAADVNARIGTERALKSCPGARPVPRCRASRSSRTERARVRRYFVTKCGCGRIVLDFSGFPDRLRSCPKLPNVSDLSGFLLVLPDRIELSTSPLPRECSTTELRQRELWRPAQGRQRRGGRRNVPQGSAPRKDWYCNR